ncbi:Cytochrome C family protein [Sphingobium herbicidovorans NBRC 16415]|uniref:Cytochrome C family protein n=1 Tax=Sphingobium herbicidovorans (strain ATCC 700291 / DSM 11019 / CCUG 56400 / KCTC 2939 / LMG 18315 / NBRC 16415 / MH) TaxID=1219045 RepID=A0A086P4G0_SPHHM|nr:cytochrome c3 family protein [Sphingobium herbicidovorans]KFG88278.1 Cytochrome C family protein [Sphingobium herbicidovorans NBRC 16415]
MSFQIRQISLTADGREIVRSATLAKPQLSLGRASENDIHLPDLALEPDHARIEQVDDRTIRVRATGTLGFDLEGRTTRDAEIDIAKGAELRLGGHRLTVSRDDDGAAVLTIRRVDAVSDASEEKEEAKVFSLRGYLPGKRLTAWGLALAILIGFLAIPIYSYASRPATDTRNIHSVKGDGAWSSGPLSQAHHALKDKCETCHEKAFVSVRDTACQTCHTSVHDHAPAARIAMARAEPGMGGKFLNLVATTFGKPPQGACVDCHSEHEGAGPMQPTPQAFCTDCHGSLKDRLRDTKLANASDFGTAHPQFTALVQYNPGKQPSFTRASLDARPMDDSGLKFPHDIHLSKTGGVARMARTLKAQNGYGDALACKDCHRPTADGVRFLPVDMERDCQSCHSLAFETIGGTVRTLRHGQPEQVIADLRAYYRSTGPAQPIALGGMARRRPGDYAQGRIYHAYFGAAAARPSRADDAIRAVFSKGGACYDCHTVTNDGARWQVTPVKQSMRYMMNGWFDHKAHATETCESCHAAPKSHDARQLLLPGIDSCRTCHGGEQSKADVPSGCAMCHSYHIGDGAPWTPTDRAVRKDQADRQRRTGRDG